MFGAASFLFEALHLI